jgi:hypothetical protein
MIGAWAMLNQEKSPSCVAANGVRCGVHSNAQNVRGDAQAVLTARHAEQDVHERQASKNF